MPRAKVSDAYGLSVELEANEASYTELGDKALDMLAKAVDIVDKRPPGLAAGVQAETRHIRDHCDPNGRSDFGFAPPKAQEGPA